MGINHRRSRNIVLRTMLPGTVVAAAFLIVGAVGWAAATPLTPPREAGQTAGPTPVRTIKDALDAVYEDGRIQQELPEEEKLRQPDLSWLAPLAEILSWLLLAGLVIGLALLIFLVLRGRFGFTRVRDAAPDAPAPGATRTKTLERDPMLWGREALVEADRLAQAGDFAEAIHVLLIGGLADLRRRLARALPPSLTSREILARIEMPTAAREALAVMITLVELSRFGFRPVGADDYGTCRERFLAFAAAEEARA